MSNLFRFNDDEFGSSNLLEAALNSIKEQLSIFYWNINQKEMESPFDNTGTKYSNDVFSVRAYDWSGNGGWNFKWKDVEISWYKYLGRAMMVNRDMSNDEISEMLNECLDFLADEQDKYLDI